jgi:hypothetical protein
MDELSRIGGGRILETPRLALPAEADATPLFQEQGAVEEIGQDIEALWMKKRMRRRAKPIRELITSYFSSQHEVPRWELLLLLLKVPRWEFPHGNDLNIDGSQEVTAGEQVGCRRSKQPTPLAHAFNQWKSKF